MLSKRLAPAVTAVLLICGCKDDSKPVKKAPADERMTIYTSIQPIAFITSKIAGKYAKVKALIPPGKSPHSFTLIPSDLKAMSKARFFFSVRLPFEEFKLEKVFENSKTEWVDITKGIQFHRMDTCGRSGCSHAHDAHGHASELMDPHIWLNPENNMILARNICNTLSMAVPEHAGYFELNFKNFTRCLIALDEKLTKMLAPFKGETFLVYHPAFGYFAQRYGLKQEAIEFGGKTPSAKHLRRVIKMAKEKKIRIIFVQPEFDRKSARLIAKTINGSVIKLDPLAYNLINNYMTFATQIQKAMKKQEAKKNGGK